MARDLATGWEGSKVFRETLLTACLTPNNVIVTAMHYDVVERAVYVIRFLDSHWSKDLSPQSYSPNLVKKPQKVLLENNSERIGSLIYLLGR